MASAEAAARCLSRSNELRRQFGGQLIRFHGLADTGTSLRSSREPVILAQRGNDKNGQDGEFRGSNTEGHNGR